MKKVIREQKPSRYRKARRDATIDAMQRTIERKFGLPNGCIKMIYPSGRKVKVDASVGSLISYWERCSN